MESPENTLFEMAHDDPNWISLKKRHGITATYIEHRDKVGAIYGTHYALGDDERQAVVKLLHMLKLEGWESVSIER